MQPGDAVAFHYQLVNSDHEYGTRNGAEAQIWWSDLATATAAPLRYVVKASQLEETVE